MKPFGRTGAATLAFIAAAFVSGPQTAAAEENGIFSLLSSATSNYTTIEHGDMKVTGGDLNGTMSVIQSSGEPFADGTDFLATCVVYATISKAATDVRSHCAMTDASGDSWFVLASRKTGSIDEGSGGLGLYDLVGGTGKYAGIGGECSYVTKYLPDNRAISRTECAWQR